MNDHAEPTRRVRGFDAGCQEHTDVGVHPLNFWAFRAAGVSQVAVFGLRFMQAEDAVWVLGEPFFFCGEREGVGHAVHVVGLGVNAHFPPPSFGPVSWWSG